jgi:tripartite-type tricarboxylate transporter receptor subunit TctC
MIAKATGIRANLIPHKGGGPLLRATLAGRLDIGSCQTTQCRPQIKAGKIRALAALGNKRFEGDPDFKHVPSMPELGYPGVGFQMERIFLVPSNTSPERIKYLRDAFVKLTKHKSYKRFMKSIGMPTQFMEGSEYDKGRPKQFAIFTELIKEMTRK